MEFKTASDFEIGETYTCRYNGKERMFVVREHQTDGVIRVELYPLNTDQFRSFTIVNMVDIH